jgi:hypothetical protein
MTSATVRKLMVSSAAALMAAALLATQATAQQTRAGRGGPTGKSASPGGGWEAMDSAGSRRGRGPIRNADARYDAFVGNRYVGSDPDRFIRSQLRRDWSVGGRN